MSGLPHMMIRTISTAALLLSVLLFQSCAEEPSSSSSQTARPQLPVIHGREQLGRVIREAGDRLLLIDFFADWCLPCRQLEPILEEIARKAKDRVDVYRIDLDGNQSLAQGFEVRGIPYVAFVKNQVIVYRLEGLHPKETYWEAVRQLSSAPGP
jgi:thioredoxin 1